MPRSARVAQYDATSVGIRGNCRPVNGGRFRAGASFSVGGSRTENASRARSGRDRIHFGKRWRARRPPAKADAQGDLKEARATTSEFGWFWIARASKRRDPAKLSARARPDGALKIEVRRVFEENFRVYGMRKDWRQLKREGFDVARCTVSTLMQDMGLETPMTMLSPKPSTVIGADHGATSNRRVRDAGMGRLVQQPAAPGVICNIPPAEAEQRY